MENGRNQGKGVFGRLASKPLDSYAGRFVKKLDKRISNSIPEGARSRRRKEILRDDYNKAVKKHGVTALVLLNDWRKECLVKRYETSQKPVKK